MHQVCQQLSVECDLMSHKDTFVKTLKFQMEKLMNRAFVTRVHAKPELYKAFDIQYPHLLHTHTPLNVLGYST